MSSRSRAAPGRNRSSAPRRHHFVDAEHQLHLGPRESFARTRMTGAARVALRFTFAAAGVPVESPADRSFLTFAGLMCPRCSHTSKKHGRRDPETGLCTRTKACDSRRQELDQETIVALGLES